MSKPELFREPLPRDTVKRLADEGFGDMIKFVVDLKRSLICAGGGLHADAETLLIEDGSLQSDLWGANYYPGMGGEDRWEYKSMINIRPGDGNTQQQIQSPEIRQQIRTLAARFLEGSS